MVPTKFSRIRSVTMKINRLRNSLGPRHSIFLNPNSTETRNRYFEIRNLLWKHEFCCFFLIRNLFVCFFQIDYWQVNNVSWVRRVVTTWLGCTVQEANVTKNRAVKRHLRCRHSTLPYLFHWYSYLASYSPCKSFRTRHREYAVVCSYAYTSGLCMYNHVLHSQESYCQVAAC